MTDDPARQLSFALTLKMQNDEMDRIDEHAQLSELARGFFVQPLKQH